MRTFDGRCVVVTGAAGGLGAALVRVFRQAGAHVVALDRDAQALQALQERESLLPAEPTWMTAVCDVTDFASCQAAMDHAVARFGGIDVLVNNAGITRDGALAYTQVDVLRDAGHPWSEIANESIIELVDSLIPFMHARGIAYMVDNCSVTARLGARKWAPRFEAAITQQVFPELDSGGVDDDVLIKSFETHAIHDVLAIIGGFRPAVDIAVP